ncbi:hypothetical protein ACF073_29035 [Streptomyces sp. NPDC015171]|uniref:hypothetical protein n=1 Tax=Streptomyces sp. NPDC015171 TaxID=3364945 RepID=UPI0036FA392E
MQAAVTTPTRTTVARPRQVLGGEDVVGPAVEAVILSPYVVFLVSRSAPLSMPTVELAGLDVAEIQPRRRTLQLDCNPPVVKQNHTPLPVYVRLTGG